MWIGKGVHIVPKPSAGSRHLLCCGNLRTETFQIQLWPPPMWPCYRETGYQDCSYDSFKYREGRKRWNSILFDFSNFCCKEKCGLQSNFFNLFLVRTPLETYEFNTLFFLFPVMEISLAGKEVRENIEFQILFQTLLNGVSVSSIWHKSHIISVRRPQMKIFHIREESQMFTWFDEF